MKKLDQFILKSFIGPFFAILAIVIFILVMQFLWLYIDELRIGVWMAESVITPFMPPKTVNTAVTAIRPMAPYQNGRPSRYSKKIPPVKAVTDTLVST